MRKIVFLLVALYGMMGVLYAQARVIQQIYTKENEPYFLYVRMKNPENSSEKLNGILENNNVTELLSSDNNVSYAFHSDAEKLENFRRHSKEVSGNTSLIDALQHLLMMDNLTKEQLDILLPILQESSEVLYCDVMSKKPIAPPYDIPPATNLMTTSQNYLNENPGVNIRYAWERNQFGAGIRVRDVEYGYNRNHEELHTRNVFVQPGMTINSSASVEYVEHGTPVFGIIMADPGNYGVTGMAYMAEEMVLFPEWQQSGYNRANAVYESVINSQQGDVILYEMQTGGQNSEYVLAEFSPVIWDITRAASDAGIIVVQAAGNGNQNLDASFYNEYNSRGDSGALVVGAGMPNLTHNRMSYSTYGSRVNVQGWGANVLNAGYGDYMMVGGDFNQAYTLFSGTSSATPVVAGCVIVLQSYYHSLFDEYLSPIEMRNLLINTGVAQGNPGQGHIGPLPNVKAAMELIDEWYQEELSVNGMEGAVFNVMIYPNPANDILNFTIPTHDVTTKQVINSLGQILFEETTSKNYVDVETLPKGVYFLKVKCGSQVSSSRFIKN